MQYQSTQVPKWTIEWISSQNYVQSYVIIIVLNSVRVRFSWMLQVFVHSMKNVLHVSLLLVQNVIIVNEKVVHT